MMWALALVSGMLGLVAMSYAVEAVRPSPSPPATPAWAPDIPVQYVTVAGMKLRYVATGAGEPVLLLHTLRTQLDMFQRVIPELAKHFRVYALDFPGHGYSDIPDVEYSPELFINGAAGFLDQLDITNALVV